MISSKPILGGLLLWATLSASARAGDNPHAFSFLNPDDAASVLGPGYASPANDPVDPVKGMTTFPKANDPLASLAKPCQNANGKLGSNWVVYPIGLMNVVSSGADLKDPKDRSPDPKRFYPNYLHRRLCAPGSLNGECVPGGPIPDFVISGTFSARKVYPRGRVEAFTQGTVMRQGRVLNEPSRPGNKVYGRGGVAVLASGKVVVCRPGESGAPMTEDAINAACAEGDDKVSDFMGGGALLINDGRKACSSSHVAGACDPTADIYKVQRFDQRGAGIKAAQMRAALRTVIATKNGKAYVMWPKVPKHAIDVQNELCTAGYEFGVAYDGGSGFFVRGSGLNYGSGINPTGFAIKIAE